MKRVAQRIRRSLPLALKLAILAFFGAVLFAASGLYNVAATSRHWWITQAFLRFTMESSARTHALPVEVPPLDDAGLIDKGAGHFETGCRPCHGAPGAPASPIAASMLPEPPDLSVTVPIWPPNQLFWVVKHGLKYTGMPAWPAQSRDDEVWAVTAFLRRLPSLSAAEYDRLAKGALAGSEAGEVPILPGGTATGAPLATCIRCHGADGLGRPSGAFPRLDIQSPQYLARALADYAEGLRASGLMQPVAVAIAPAEREGLAHHFGRADPLPPDPPAAAGAGPELGRRIAMDGLPQRGIAACRSCHGLAEGPANPLYPTLAGQYAGYTAMQLRLFRDGKHGSGAFSDIMQAVARPLGDAEIDALARFYEALGAATPAPAAAQP
jgi:cytochrome c553